MMSSVNVGSTAVHPKAASPNHRAVYSAVPAETAKIENLDKTLSLRRTFHVSWWERRTPKEKKLIICLPILLIVILIIIAVFSSVLAQPDVDPQVAAGNASVLSVSATRTTETCVTWKCVLAAAAMMRSMNGSVHPCDDFFQYACGSHPQGVYPDWSGTHFTRIRYEQDKQLKELLEAPSSPNEVEIIRNVKALYNYCYSEGTFDGIEDSIWFEEDLLAEKNRTTFDLAIFLAKLRLLTHDQGIFAFYVEADVKKPAVNVIYFDQPKRLPYIPPMNRSARKFSEAIDSSTLSQQFTSFSVLFDVPERNNTMDLISEVLKIDEEMKSIMMPLNQRRNQHGLYNRMTVADMYSNLTEKFDWLKFLRVIFDGVNVTIGYDENVVILVPEFFKKLGNLLSRVSPKAVAAYLLLGAHSDILSGFSQNQPIDIPMGYETIAEEVWNYRLTTWYRCTTFIKDAFGMVVSRLFFDEHLLRGKRETVNEMVEEIRAAFVDLVDEASWVDAESNKLIKEKAKALKAKVGYPDEIFNDAQLNRMYGNISRFLTKNFTENAIEIRKTFFRYSFTNLRRAVDQTRWLVAPITVNAYYVSLRNEIIIPASIMREPFYRDINMTRALNFGGIGYVIGHELTHGFGDKGRQFDKDGHLRVWWPDNVTTNFDERADCFVDKYSNYTFSRVQIDGLRTLAENIADDGGLRIAFRAYREWVRKQGREEQELPGLSLSGNQLFFLQFAQVMCSRSEYEFYSAESAKVNAHCPWEIRVLGTLSNSRDFAETYGCKADRRMNPVKKCRIW